MLCVKLQNVQNIKIMCLFLIFIMWKIMHTSENHFNTKASDCAIEEIYTKWEINENCEYDPKIGYSFYYPYRFANDPAQLKAVGIRHINIEPENHTVGYNIEVGYYTETLRWGTKTGSCYGVVNSTTSLINELNSTCDWFNKNTLYYLRRTYGIELKFDYDGNKVRFYLWDSKNNEEYIAGQLRITGYHDFLEFYNQPKDFKVPKFDKCTHEQILEGVWDREYIEFHASFSDSNRNFIGLNGDFYPRPSLFYLVPSNTTGFNITFTDRDRNPILPRYCNLVVQLCFVLNYKMFRI